MMDQDTKDYLQSSPRYMMIMLDYLHEHYGSAQAYLESIGLSEDEVMDLKDSFII